MQYKIGIKSKKQILQTKLYNVNGKMHNSGFYSKTGFVPYIHKKTSSKVDFVSTYQGHKAIKYNKG